MWNAQQSQTIPRVHKQSQTIIASLPINTLKSYTRLTPKTRVVHIVKRTFFMYQNNEFIYYLLLFKFY